MVIVWMDMITSDHHLINHLIHPILFIYPVHPLIHHLPIHASMYLSSIYPVHPHPSIIYPSIPSIYPSIHLPIHHALQGSIERLEEPPQLLTAMGDELSDLPVSC